MATSVESVAFAGMYDAHASELLRYLWRRCGDRAQAKDLLSVVFLEAWRSPGGPAAGRSGAAVAVRHRDQRPAQSPPIRASPPRGARADRGGGADLRTRD